MIWIIIGVVVAVVLIVAAFFVGIQYRVKIGEAQIGGAEKKAQDIINTAKQQAENKKREVLLETKEEVLKTKTEAEREIKNSRDEIAKQESRIIQKEESLDQKMTGIEEKTNQLAEKDKQLEEKLAEAAEIHNRHVAELEKIASLTREEAKKALIENIQDEARLEAAQSLKKIEEETKENANSMAKNIIGTAIQRCAADHIAEFTVSVVPLPNDEVKGRIIGREGRNIRTLETLTGIDFIIDDTPEAVVLSGFDPVRREIARLTLEKAVSDGRIQPAKIEEFYEKSKKEVDDIIKKEGERATFETNVHGLHPELVRLLGRLKYRTSFGQNVLNHSIEVANITGLLAAELGEDVTMAKRAGLLHDIGKSTDQDQEGSHVSIGAEIARKYKEKDVVVNAIMSHHGDVEPTSVISVLVAAADAISAARPGARRENVETYIKRLRQLEEIATGFKGVDKAFAIQAGREIRVIVKPEAVNDDSTLMLAKDVAKKIESEMEYPGQIKVNVIRETRAIEYAS